MRQNIPLSGALHGEQLEERKFQNNNNDFHLHVLHIGIAAAPQYN
jgi:hypothetical protein